MPIRLGNRPFALGSCNRAGAVDAGKSSTLGDEVGLVKEAASGLYKWDGPAGQRVLTLLVARSFRSCALSALSAISAPVMPLALALPWVFFSTHSLFLIK